MFSTANVSAGVATLSYCLACFLVKAILCRFLGRFGADFSRDSPIFAEILGSKRFEFFDNIEVAERTQ